MKILSLNRTTDHGYAKKTVVDSGIGQKMKTQERTVTGAVTSKKVADNFSGVTSDTQK